jgi:hypothetical protein
MGKAATELNSCDKQRPSFGGFSTTSRSPNASLGSRLEVCRGTTNSYRIEVTLLPSLRGLRACSSPVDF